MGLKWPYLCSSVVLFGVRADVAAVVLGLEVVGVAAAPAVHEDEAGALRVVVVEALLKHV